MRSISLLGGIAAACLCLAATAAAADILVVRANGPSAARYPAGKTLPDAARLQLQRGDQVVVLDAHGTRTLSGPGIFAAKGDAAAAAAPTLTELASASVSRRARVGAVRNVPDATGATTRPGIFLVDTAVPGRVCIVDPAGVTLWRADAGAAATSTVTGQTGAAATLTWIKGQSTQGWPAALPVTEGASYRLAAAGGIATPIEFHLLAGGAPADLQALAAALIAQRCKGQIDVLVATTSTPAGN